MTAAPAPTGRSSWSARIGSTLAVTTPSQACLLSSAKDEETTYDISHAYSVNEGKSLSVNISPKNLKWGTVLYWSTSGIGVTADDFSSGATG